MAGQVLVVDDDASIRETFRAHLEGEGYEVEVASDGREALRRLPELDPILVITDVRMEGLDGLEFLKRARKSRPRLDVIVMTAFEDMRTAVRAMTEGAYDYLVKPLDLDELDLVIGRCLRDRALRRRVEGEVERETEVHRVDQLVGKDPAMISIYKTIGVLAGNRAPVLVRGETGTGKERIARAIHYASPAAGEPFLAVNCTALTESLLESELFGHVRGAFTGAVESRKGYFELAGDGTVLLDEIGDTTTDFQAKLLRVLQEGEFYPVGGEKPRRTRARVTAATHRPLEALMERGEFREDLYFRLRVVEIRVPPLRERRGDVPLLARYLLGRIREQLHQEVAGISKRAMDRLVAYDWPGNVRELENALARAAVRARGGVIDVEHLTLEPPSARALPTDADPGPDATLAEVEAAHIQRVLGATGGNKRQTARTLGISRPRLDRLIDKHALHVPTGRR